MIQRQQLTKPAKANFTTHCAPETQDTSGPLEVVVLFTDVQGTLRALKTAAELARNLNGRIRLLAPQVVPYPLVAGQSSGLQRVQSKGGFKRLRLTVPHQLELIHGWSVLVPRPGYCALPGAGTRGFGRDRGPPVMVAEPEKNLASKVAT